VVCALSEDQKAKYPAPSLGNVPKSVQEKFNNDYAVSRFAGDLKRDQGVDHYHSHEDIDKIVEACPQNEKAG